MVVVVMVAAVAVLENETSGLDRTGVQGKGGVIGRRRSEEVTYGEPTVGVRYRVVGGEDREVGRLFGVGE